MALLLEGMNMDRIGVIGGGSFGSAIADIMAHQGIQVALWFRNLKSAEEFNQTHENKKYLPGITLSSHIEATSSLKEASRDCSVVFVCVPSLYFREVAHQLGAWMDGSQILISTTKGIEASTFKLMTEILREETCCLKIGALSGPNLAKEIAAKIPSGTVIASRHDEVIEKVQQILSCSYFRVYGNHDVQGVELGGVLKNVYAIATGLMASMKMGDNTFGMVLTRGLAEMSRFATQFGANPLTFLGLAGVGDLVTTCSSPLSRNYRMGYLIGQGKTLKEAIEEVREVAEGVHTIHVVFQKSKELGIRMHILEGLHALLFENKDIPTVLRELMNIPQMEDVEFSLQRH